MSGGFVGGFVLGLLVGAGLALVAMARRGAEAIELFAQRADRVRDRADNLIGQVRSGASETEESAAGAIEPAGGDATDRVLYTAAGMQ
jgi:gas vesicle protein